MKRLLRITAACLAVLLSSLLFPAKAATQEAVVATSENGTGFDYYPLTFYSDYTSYASQSLYPASVLEDAISADSYTIKQLVYPLLTVPTTGKFTVSVYLAQSDATELSDPLAVSDFTLVTSGCEVDCSDIADGKLRLPIDAPFEMQKGKSLVIGLYGTTTASDKPSPDMAFEGCSIDGACGNLTIYNSTNPASVSFEGAALGNDAVYGKVAGLSLVYEVAQDVPTPAAIDLAAVSVQAPAGEFYVGYSYDFVVTVENKGTESVESYTVELVNTADDSVVATFNSNEELNSGWNKRVKLEVTFDEPGTYSIAARVIAEDDEVADNDECEPVEVVVEKLPYKAVSLTVAPEAPALGEKATFTVAVSNEGEEALEGYTVNLYLVREGSADKLVATATVAEATAIAVGATANVTFDYTFELAGAYAFKAEVVKGAGVPSFTPVLNLEVALDGKLTPVITDQVPEWDKTTNDYMGYPISRNSVNSASQLLYPASYFGNHENDYQIQSLAFTVLNEEYKIDPVEMKIYLAQVDRTEGYARGDRTTLVAADEFTLVYDGIFATEQTKDAQVVTLDLQRLFTLENGKALVVNIETVATGNAKYMVALAAAQTESNYVAYVKSAEGYDYDPDEDYSIYDSATGSLNVTNLLPCLTLGYALEPLPAKVDLKATSIELTT